MPLQPIKLRPGIDRSSTNYGNKGGYFACDKVRFRFGMPEKIGGWVKYTTSKVIGTPRALFNWTTLNASNLLAIGTNVKYYVEQSGGLYDITPLRTTTTLGSNPIALTSGSSVATVTHTGHGAADGDYVTLSSATGFANAQASDLNREFQVSVVNANSYKITLPVVANATTTGGGTPSAAFQITTAASVAMPGKGWGAGKWGHSGGWGSAAGSVVYRTLRLWSQEAFGENHVFCLRGGPIYFWNFSLGLNHRATPLTAEAGASNVPLMATCILMSTQDRHLIAFGCNPVGSTTQDPLLIRWCDTEDLTDWTPTSTNASGDLRCSSGNRIVTAVRLKQEIVVFTDSSIASMQYVGAPFTFGLQPAAENTSIMSPQAVAAVGSVAFWMGRDKFYMYNGQADTLGCPIHELVFDDINMTQADQVFAGTNEGFSEIWWFYCSKDSSTIDRYVIFNYVEKSWYYGSMERSAWLDTPLKSNPLAASADGTLYLHENGCDDDRLAPIHAWVESADFDLGNGDDFMFATRVLPDVEFTGSETDKPSVNLTLTVRNSPGGSYGGSNSGGVERSVEFPVEQFTERLDVRLRGRQMKIRVESTDLGVHWKLGVPRIDMKGDGAK